VNAPGSFVAPRFKPFALQAAKPTERRRQRFALIDHARLPPGRDGVAPKERGIERHARLRRQPLVAVSVEQRERREIANVVGDNLFREAVAWNLDSGEAAPPLLP